MRGEGNRFGHPGRGALSRFASVGARVLRTDLDGTITLDDEVGSWRASVEKDRRRNEREGEDESECERERETSGP